MKNFKSILIGASAAVLNYSTTFLQVFRPEKCIGRCGACGSCVPPLLGLIGIGGIWVLFSKLKKRLLHSAK